MFHEWAHHEGDCVIDEAVNVAPASLCRFDESFALSLDVDPSLNEDRRVQSGSRDERCQRALCACFIEVADRHTGAFVV